ncbi:MAG: PD-(D/E)XK nuclease family protein [Thermofilaceae archaeon]|nr:PD-(D/E)XK nuclease family protein [Thermofilaceae archaeon]MDW8003575.1 PD-(D/E)XK nuclease family protein [Thermofilaceae archaeon]
MSLSEREVEELTKRALRDAYFSEREVVKSAPVNVVYPTELNQCLRKSWYERMVAEPPQPERLVLFLLGEKLHDVAGEYFPLGSGEKSFEKTVEGVIVRGRLDRELESCIVEFKSVTSIPEKPRPYHVDQAQIYMWLTDKEQAFVVYVSKSTGEVKAFKVERDEARIQELLRKAVEYSIHLQRGFPPPPEPGWLCKYCEYAHLCPSPQGEESGNR